MTHLSETALENYLLGGDELDTATVEEHLLACDECAAHVRAQIELEMQLGEVARAATFCPGCNRVLDGDRCDACGSTLSAGGYRIERVLVRTTHGRLYSAIDGSGNRVALKELAFVQAPTLESLAAFDRETKFLRALSHPCIPRFHASFIEGTGIHTRMYIAQDLVDGESLLARLQTHWFTDAEIVDIARRILDILIYLQSLSPMVFHRDIKPANLIVRPDGSIALVDFGAARDVSETMGNTAVGTFGYMPLEQMAGVYDATTDLFALGASLLHLLTRREPWKLLDGSGVGLNVSLGLRAYLDRLCARNAQLRFPNARAARAALDDLNNTPSTPRRSLSRITVISTVALMGLGVGAGALMAVREKEESHLVIAPTVAREPERPRPAVPMPRREEQQVVRVPPLSPPPSPPPQELPRITYLDVEELLGPGLVGVKPIESKCSILDRLPSGECPRTSSVIAPGSSTKLPDHIEARIAKLPASDATLLRQQIEYARAQVAKYRAGGIAIGKIVKGATGYYYAAAVAGAYEVALHGYRRHVLPGVPKGEVVWVPDVVLARAVADRVTITGTAQPGTEITASVIHRFVAASGPAVTISPTPAVRTTVDGEFKLSGFSPGDYRFTITHDGTREAFDLSLPQGGELDLSARFKSKAEAVGDGYIVVSSNPKAMLVIDGVTTGVSTPTKLKMAAGKHKISFVYGTTRSSFPVRVVANETLTFHKDLE